MPACPACLPACRHPPLAARAGIIVFPTGDIVVRLAGCAPGGRCGVDQTIESSYLSTATVVRRCSCWPHARPMAFLVLTYLQIDARTATIAIAQTDLRDSVQRIATYIQETKGRSHFDAAGGSALFGGGL